MPILEKPPMQWPFAALSAPIATDVRELSVLLPGTLAGQTPRQEIQFTQKVEVVGFFAEVISASAVGGGAVAPNREDILVQLDLDDRMQFTSQDSNQVIQGKWVSLSAMLVTGNILKLIRPGNTSPVFGVSFRWKLAPTAFGGARIYEDALITFDCFHNLPEAW